MILLLASIGRGEIVGLICVLAAIYVAWVGFTFKGHEHEGVELPPGLYVPPGGEDYIALANEHIGLTHHAAHSKEPPKRPPPAGGEEELLP